MNYRYERRTDATILGLVDWPALKELLKRLRMDAHLSPAQLANRMGVRRSTINRIEDLRTRADNAVDLDTIELWTRAVEITLPSFFEQISALKLPAQQTEDRPSPAEQVTPKDEIAPLAAVLDTHAADISRDIERERLRSIVVEELRHEREREAAARASKKSKSRAKNRSHARRRA